MSKLLYKKKTKTLKDIIFPNIDITRKSLFFDESGEEKMPNSKISYGSPERYFIYTTVIFNNYDIKKVEGHYFNIKKKHLGGNIPTHSTRLFRKDTKKNRAFIKALADFIDTLPFLYITVIVDKKKLFEKSSMTKIKDPKSSSFREALSIWVKEKQSKEDFYKSPVKDILSKVSNYKIRNIYSFQPLNLAYENILNFFFNKLNRKLLETQFSNINNVYPKVELIFETSPNRERILQLTEQLRSSEKKLGKTLKENIYDISFPYKKAKYMGLEIADIISYGYHLKKYKRLGITPLYNPIRKVIRRRENVVKKELGLESVISI